MIALLLAAALAHGVYRWDVKTLQDEPHISAVKGHATVCALGQLVRRNVVGRDDAEKMLWATTGTLIARKHEADGDIHLVIAAPPDSSVVMRGHRLEHPGDCTMICEVPDPRNIPLAHRREVAAARASALTIPLGSRVAIEGVGFYDLAEHGGGHSPNGFEIHPVLAIARLP